MRAIRTRRYDLKVAYNKSQVRKPLRINDFRGYWCSGERNKFMPRSRAFGRAQSRNREAAVEENGR